MLACGCAQASPACWHLVKAMLRSEIGDRPNVAEVLRHPWMQVDMPAELAAVNDRLMQAGPLHTPSRHSRLSPWTLPNVQSTQQCPTSCDANQGEWSSDKARNCFVSCAWPAQLASAQQRNAGSKLCRLTSSPAMAQQQDGGSGAAVSRGPLAEVITASILDGDCGAAFSIRAS